MENNKSKAVLGILRISMGLIFLWAFFDKVFGLGFSTKPEQSWLAGGSPTAGFLKAGVHGPFVDFFHSLSGVPMVDWLFMLGLLFVGITLTLGISMKFGGWAGISMLFLMYLSVGLPPTTNPFIDDHVTEILVILVLMFTNAGTYFGMGNAWARSSFAQKYKIFS